jgi:hypothetical protein
MDTVTMPSVISSRSYHQDHRDYIGSTSLKQMLVSPKWFKYCQDHPEESRIRLENELKGSVYHAMLASLANNKSIDGFMQEWEVFKPPINDKTGKPYGYDTQRFQLAYEEAGVMAGNKEICSQTEIDLARAMIDAMLGDPCLGPDIKFFLENGQAENSYFVEYDGMKFKYRPDIETRGKLLDWKSCQDASPDAIAQTIIRLNYHISGAFYQFFDHLRTGIWRHWFWVFQEKMEPFDLLIVDGKEWCFEIQKDGDEQIAIPKEGAHLLLKLLEQYKWCLDNDRWPGYSIFVEPDWKKHRIYTPTVPGWYKKAITEKIFFNQ